MPAMPGSDARLADARDLAGMRARPFCSVNTTYDGSGDFGLRAGADNDGGIRKSIVNHIHRDDDQAASRILRETQGNKCTKYAVGQELGISREGFGPWSSFRMRECECGYSSVMSTREQIR